jgi:hypothetical protein
MDWISAIKPSSGISIVSASKSKPHAQKTPGSQATFAVKF